MPRSIPGPHYSSKMATGSGGIVVARILARLNCHDAARLIAESERYALGPGESGCDSPRGLLRSAHQRSPSLLRGRSPARSHRPKFASKLSCGYA
jgi:hypothetical protein